MATLTYVGTGEAIDPTLANTSLLYRGARALLLDCGYAVPHALWSIEPDPNAIDGVYLSHLHADHAFGLPALALWMRLGGRTRPLALLGAAATVAGARRILELGYPGSFGPDKCFPIEAVALSSSSATAWGEMELRIAPSDHKRMANHAVVVAEQGAARFGYSGDGRPSPATRELFARVPHVVHECFGHRVDTTPEGHASLDELLKLGTQLGTRRLDLLHFARDQRARIAQAIDALDTDALGFVCRAATPGMEVVLE